MTADAQDITTEPSPDSTDAWMVADRAHLERLVADAEVEPAPKRRWWKRKPLPWLVVRQHQRKEHVVSAHRWEWFAERRAVRRERRHRSQVGVFYTARHRTEISKGDRAEVD